jgi:hypothetical protein
LFPAFGTGTGCGYSQGIFRTTENSSQGVAGNIAPIVHTARAFKRRLIKLPRKKTA